MAVEELFPTLIYYDDLQKRGVSKFNEELEDEAFYFAEMDTAGLKWSKKNYIGGYTSFASLSNLHEISGSVTVLKEKIDRHVKKYLKALQFDADFKDIEMSDCWVNIMPTQTTHGLHIHPLSFISGTYYVRTPPGSSAIKFEDPRLTKFMASPPRKQRCRKELKQWISYPAEVGKLVLFESWMRHEVPPSTATDDRISISFNYNWK